MTATGQIDSSPAGRTVDRATIDRLAGVHGGPSLVFVNGLFDPDRSDIDPAIAGVWLGEAAAGLAAVFVDSGAQVDEPIQVVHLRDPDLPGSDEAHTVIQVGRGASLHVIESYVASGGTASTAATTRIVVAQDAHLRLHRVVSAEPDATHTATTVVRQEANSTLRATSILVDGAHVRSEVEVDLAGQGARVDLDGLHAPTGHQVHEHAVVVTHAAANCTSTQHVKGIVDDHARGVFASHVIVRPGADGTDASQSNPNLVLSSTAEADTRPWLEILADDVACSHGATVGRLDDDALFYLRSRGIPATEARAVLIEAFASEITSSIRPESLRATVEAGLDRAWIGTKR